LLSAIVGEYTRRTTAVSNGTYNGTWTATPTYTAYTTTPATGGTVLLEHMTKYFTDVNNFPSSGRSDTATQFSLIQTANITGSITYVQGLMNANIVK
jgi:hypothetical protein